MDRFAFTPPRQLTEQERKVTRWIIEHGDCAQTEFLRQLDEAMVVRRCPCGCASVNFAIDDKESPKNEGLTILGDFLCGDEQSGISGVFVFARSGVLAGIEIYQLSDENIHTQLPDVDTLRSFEAKNI